MVLTTNLVRRNDVRENTGIVSVQPQLDVQSNGGGIVAADRRQCVRGRERGHGAFPRASMAIRAIQKVGMDISGYTSKGVTPFLEKVWHDVITVCDHVNEYCPIFPFPSQRLQAFRRH
jgi:hypothetical protein